MINVAVQRCAWRQTRHAIGFRATCCESDWRLDPEPQSKPEVGVGGWSACLSEVLQRVAVATELLPLSLTLAPAPTVPCAFGKSFKGSLLPLTQALAKNRNRRWVLVRCAFGRSYTWVDVATEPLKDTFFRCLPVEVFKRGGCPPVRPLYRSPPHPPTFHTV
ncbi:unnamed protein product, partial [Ectocarpus sp. 12 AP-2014]